MSINKYADMNEDSKKFLLQEKEIPEAWYNVVAEMPNKPRPMLNPATKQPLTAEDLFPLSQKRHRARR